MPGTLFVVATPIGNLEDLSFRALRVLREADVIAAEDTRRTAKLLAHYGIATPTLSFHQHNTRSRLPHLLNRLARGQAVALVTDAGSPGISDPGVELVRACVDKGLPVDPVPGPCAPVTAAIASGFPLEPLTIFGFVPSRSKDRNTWIERIQAISHTFTFFEAPHRIARTLSSLERILVDRPICVARELTKIHQQFLRGSAGEIVGHMTAVRGEFTVVVGPGKQLEAERVVSNDLDIYREFGRLNYSGGVGRRGVVAELARKYGVSSNYVYLIIEKHKGSVV